MSTTSQVKAPKRTFQPYTDDKEVALDTITSKRKRTQTPDLEEEPPTMIDCPLYTLLETTSSTPEDFYVVSPSFSNENDIFRSKKPRKARRSNESIRDIEDMLVLRIANPI
mmetsp:Transcript_18509/g.28571  ORF Transcript_18509/g.28571 Transcript_18509/m.28571 type:complete len:111 (+) Transcript_18509:205-537(+)|eukprot:CAMPEP_0195253432 /NCGR_PEP_ID=MMETSP0706-20130129/4461_1 /TAXON_ID=33640 /ORGANISM="Asterionellopsis glacialis, Strain CCMP134" /LENGTH=110 /DNA_ID=CAMNT_0040305931 /DNA_START=29 /DNA_END=361 /DNA_ORIENTATION=+